jgi:hypothetical protein
MHSCNTITVSSEANYWVKNLIPRAMRRRLRCPCVALDARSIGHALRALIAWTLGGGLLITAASGMVETVNAQMPNASQKQAETSQELPAGTLPESLWRQGWISLFDGQSLFGWQAATGANWHVESGSIVVSEGEKGLLCTTFPFSDYELHVEFHAEDSTNSGIFLRTPLRPTDPRVDCYELNIAPPDNPFPTGSLVGRKRVAVDTTGSGWRSFDVLCQGGTIQVRLDDKKVLEYQDDKPIPLGFIGLQFNQGRIAFRNIRLRPIHKVSLFDGTTLDQWKTFPDQPVQVESVQGVLRLKGGRGMIESRQAFGDFLLQLECRTGAANTNSGVFFRCIPGEMMNGYECQIHNGYQQGDRKRPVDQGTGAIFRRQPARIVAADDGRWFGLTIIAVGSRMGTWVNGLQVTDWIDERPPSPNPRLGKRIEAGTIMLQGHDPTTHVEFRNIRITELSSSGSQSVAP